MSMYQDIISVENLFRSWDTFKKGKKRRNDIQIFDRHLEDNIFKLHSDLHERTYKRDSYEAFFVIDPKRRHIHKANVTDRIVHQALYSKLYPIFDRRFIYDSYSCRNNKGTHRAVIRLRDFLRKESENNTRNCFALHCDIEKFFASANTAILFDLIEKHVGDESSLRLIKEILDSFSHGLPLGNLTSQLFANVYLNELDQFVEHSLRVNHYIRYCDDFVIIHRSKRELQKYTETLRDFLWKKLHLRLNEKKIIIRKYSWGIDFLGYIVLPHYILPRTRTKRRLIKKLFRKLEMKKKREITTESLDQTIQSYLGYLQHGDTHKLTEKLKNDIYLKI